MAVQIHFSLYTIHQVRSFPVFRMTRKLHRVRGRTGVLAAREVPQEGITYMYHPPALFGLRALICCRDHEQLKGEIMADIPKTDESTNRLCELYQPSYGPGRSSVGENPDHVSRLRF